MADVNWARYRCNICLMIGLALSAVVSGLIGWLLLSFAPLILSLLLFFAIWAILGFVIDAQCRTSSARVPATAPLSDAGPSASLTPDQAARAAEERAAAEAAEEAKAERRAAEQAAAAERRASDEKAAAAEAERRAAEQAAEAERRAAVEAAEAERKAAQERESAEQEAERRAVEAAADAERRAAAPTTSETAAGVIKGEGEGTRPVAFDGPRGGIADDLKRIKGIGPKLEELCNKLGFYHFDQIAAWTADEVAWVDSNLEGFKGRVSRDDWVVQAGMLAAGGETEFSKRVDDGDVPSSQ